MTERITLEQGHKRNLVEVLRNRCDVVGDRRWIVDGDRVVTYHDADLQSTRLAHGLSNLGVAAGDNVLVLLPNCVNFVYSWCAIAKLGAVHVPLNTAARGELLKYQINNSAAKVILVDEGLLDRVEQISTGLESIAVCIVQSKGASEQDLRQRAPGLAQRCGIVGLSELFSDKTSTLPSRSAYREIGSIIYTSGTTGASKGVMAPHAHAFGYARAVTMALDIEVSDINLTALPLFHVAGLWAGPYASALTGTTCVIVDSFHASTFWSDVARYGATTTFLLGSMASFLYRRPEVEEDAQTPMAKVLMAPLIPEVQQFKRRFGVRVSTAYSLTEVGGCGAIHVLDLPNATSCGRPIEEMCEIKIVDADDEVVEDGVVGEIVVRPNEPWSTMQGYWRQPDKTLEAWRNLWFHTGDLGTRDHDGNLYFIDRIKDAIRRRGENISSVEVENEILRHPGVLECAVIPVSSEDTEQEIMAVIVPHENVQVTAEEIVRFLDGRLAYFMVPRFIEITSTLPKTETGKVQKAVLRQRGLSSAVWDRCAAGIKLSR